MNNLHRQTLRFLMATEGEEMLITKYQKFVQENYPEKKVPTREAVRKMFREKLQEGVTEWN